MNGNQSSVTNSKRVLSSLCIDCHFHFVFKIEWDENHTYECCNPEQAAWPMKDSLFPWHHLVWTGSEPDPMLAQYKSKYQPLLAREYFVCTAPPCTFQITLDVLEPRMGRWWIQLLQDEEAVLAQLKKAKELEPQRYEGANESWASLAPQNLNTYLKDLIESDPDQVRNVSKRNKKFAVVFGPRCAEIFRQLEFTDEILLNEKGIDEGVLVPKVPDRLPQPGATTPLGTFRAYIEDVRAEVQCLIHKRGHGAELPTYILPLLQQSLGYTGTLKITNQHLINIDRYMLLGILPDQSKEVIVNTYFRQWDLLPSKKRELIDALVGVANDVSDEQLSEFAVTQQSVFESQLERHDDNTDDDGITNQAIIYLGLSPPNTYDAETIINAFRKKLVQQPDDASTARNMLMMIAQASSSGEYQELLLTEATGLSFETSKAILEFTGWAGDWKQCLQLGEKKVSCWQDEQELCT
jgi:ubiquitin carboxyl-terminal hydrolase 25